VIPSQWKSFARPNGEREHLALLSYLPLQRFRLIPRFLIYASAIEGQLRDARGLVGYSLQAQVLRRRFWTLSVWEGERSLMEFVGRSPHGQMMCLLAPHMGGTKFTRWKLKGSAIPPTWDEAKRRMPES